MNIPPNFREKLGEVIRQNRKQTGISQAVLAERAGVTRRFIQELENGRSDISLQTLFQLSTAMNIAMSDVCSQIEQMLTNDFLTN